MLVFHIQQRSFWFGCGNSRFVTNCPIRHWPNVSMSLVYILQAVYNENPWGGQASFQKSSLGFCATLSGIYLYRTLIWVSFPYWKASVEHKYLGDIPCRSCAGLMSFGPVLSLDVILYKRRLQRVCWSWVRDTHKPELLKRIKCDTSRHMHLLLRDVSYFISSCIEGRGDDKKGEENLRVHACPSISLRHQEYFIWFINSEEKKMVSVRYWPQEIPDSYMFVSSLSFKFAICPNSFIQVMFESPSAHSECCVVSQLLARQGCGLTSLGSCQRVG